MEVKADVGGRVSKRLKNEVSDLELDMMLLTTSFYKLEPLIIASSQNDQQQIKKKLPA